MKRSFRILMSLLVLMVIAITAHAVGHVEFTAAVDFVKDNGEALALAPVIASTSITTDLVNQLRVKYGKIKMITVVVEAAIYDIDELKAVDRANLHALGIDVSTVSNKELSLEERLKPLEKLFELRDDKDKSEFVSALSHLSGKTIQEGEQYQFLVKRPDRSLIKMLLPLAQSGKIDDFADKAVKNLIVGGDVDSLDDGLVYMGVVSKLKEMIAPAQAFLSNA